MTEPTTLGDLDLAALVSSRICHDVINPVSAISNGLEMLAEEPDQAMRDAAMDLIRKSAAQASAKLQFARLAFGAAGSAGAEIDLRDGEKVSREFVAGTGKHQVVWQGPPITLPKNKVKLLLNLVALGVVARVHVVHAPPAQALLHREARQLRPRRAQVGEPARRVELEHHLPQVLHHESVVLLVRRREHVGGLGLRMHG